MTYTDEQTATCRVYNTLYSRQNWMTMHEICRECNVSEQVVYAIVEGSIRRGSIKKTADQRFLWVHETSGPVSVPSEIDYDDGHFIAAL